MGCPQLQRKGRRSLAYAVIEAVIMFAIFMAAECRPGEPPADRAYELCAQCGLGPDEADHLIDNAVNSTFGREELVRLYVDTFEDRTSAEACRAGHVRQRRRQLPVSQSRRIEFWTTLLKVRPALSACSEGVPSLREAPGRVEAKIIGAAK